MHENPFGAHSVEEQSEVVLKDERRKNWFWDYNYVFKSKLSAHAKLVRLFLAQCANKDRLAWPSMKTIAEACGISRATAKRAVHELVEEGWLKKNTRQKDNGEYISNTFILCDPPEAEGIEKESGRQKGGSSLNLAGNEISEAGRVTGNLPCNDLTEGGRVSENLPCNDLTEGGSVSENLPCNDLTGGGRVTGNQPCSGLTEGGGVRESPPCNNLTGGVGSVRTRVGSEGTGVGSHRAINNTNITILKEQESSITTIHPSIHQNSDEKSARVGDDKIHPVDSVGFVDFPGRLIEKSDPTFKNLETIKSFLVSAGFKGSQVEVEFIGRWGEVFPGEMIQYALSKSVLGGKKNLFYVEGIFNSWVEKGIRSLEEAKGETRYDDYIRPRKTTG